MKISTNKRKLELSPSSIYAGLMAWGEQTEATANHLFQHHYDDLMGIARSLRRRKNLSDTLLTSDLVNEAFLRLRTTDHWRNRGHFFACVALAMRHVALDHHRSKNREKRGGGLVPVEYNDALDGLFSESLSEDSLDLHSLITELADRSPQQMRIIDCRFFAGFTTQETADILGINERTVRREWNRARTWLAARLEPELEVPVQLTIVAG